MFCVKLVQLVTCCFSCVFWVKKVVCICFKEKSHCYPDWVGEWLWNQNLSFSRPIFHWIKRSIYKACISLAQGRNNTSSVVFMSFAISGGSPFLANLSYLGEQYYHIRWFTVVYCSTAPCVNPTCQFPVFGNYFDKQQVFSEWGYICNVAGLFVLTNNVNY